jgi:hypothetical protein
LRVNKFLKIILVIDYLFSCKLLGLVTPARDQMSCGSCAAFAATGAHETCMLKAGARFNGLDLSEQMLVDCGFNGADMNGCKGAHSGSYGRVFANQLAGQSPHEITYPYLNINPNLKCPVGKTIYNSGAYVKTPMEDFYCSEDKLKQQVIHFIFQIFISDMAIIKRKIVVFLCQKSYQFKAFK